MTGMIIIGVLLVVLAIAGPLWGADSRDGKDWHPFGWPGRRPPDDNGE